MCRLKNRLVRALVFLVFLYADIDDASLRKAENAENDWRCFPFIIWSHRKATIREPGKTNRPENIEINNIETGKTVHCENYEN